MSQAAEQILVDGLQQLDLELDALARTKLLTYADLVLRHNLDTNLTGARSLQAFITEQLLDSLSVLTIFRPKAPVLDLGSGAGLPGIPLALVHPKHELVLLEPRTKRVEFLRKAVAELELGNVQIVKSSAKGPAARELSGAMKTVLLRAVAEPAKALTIGCSFLDPTGFLVLYQGRAKRPTGPELSVARRLDLSLVKAGPVHVPGLKAARNIWIFRRHTAAKG